MDDNELKKIHEMMLQAISDALCISVRAIAMQIDPKKLESDLRTEIAIAALSNVYSNVSLQLSKDVLNALIPLAHPEVIEPSKSKH